MGIEITFSVLNVNVPWLQCMTVVQNERTHKSYKRLRGFPIQSIAMPLTYNRCPLILCKLFCYAGPGI